MKTVQKNIVANYIGRIWSFVSAFIFVPFYLKLLGVESYAIIQFYAVLMGVMVFADAGLTTTLNREFARVDKDCNYRANLLRTIEWVYLAICITVIAGITIAAPWIAKQWLHAENLAVSETTLYVRLIGVAIAFQLMTTLYQGGLMGLQKQVLANSLQVGWSVLRSGIVLIPLYFHPSLVLYFTWQVALNIIYLAACRLAVQRNIHADSRPKFHLQYFKNIWRFAAGMMCMSLLSATLIQMDKLVTGKMLSLVEFGYYALASTLAQTPIILVTPISLAIFPRLTQLASEKENESLINVFRSYSFIITSIACIVSFVLIIYMQDILFIWTHDATFAESVYQVAQVLCLGSLFQAIQLMPFYLGLANGHTKTNIFVGVCSIIFMLPTLILLISRIGLNGAGYPWLIMSVCSFFVLGYIIIRKFMRGQYKVWLTKDVLLPISISAIIMLGFYAVTAQLPKGYFVILYSAIAAIVALICCAIVFQKLHYQLNIIRMLTQFRNTKKQYEDTPTSVNSNTH